MVPNRHQIGKQWPWIGLNKITLSARRRNLGKRLLAAGSKGRAKRPGFDRLLKDAARRKFDIILAWSVDRLGDQCPIWWPF